MSESKSKPRVLLVCGLPGPCDLCEAAYQGVVKIEGGIAPVVMCEACLMTVVRQGLPHHPRLISARVVAEKLTGER